MRRISGEGRVNDLRLTGASGTGRGLLPRVGGGSGAEGGSCAAAGSAIDEPPVGEVARSGFGYVAGAAGADS